MRFQGDVGNAPGGSGVLRTIDVQTEGVLTIDDGVLLRTSTGAVSNVPPRLSIVEQFPGKPLGEDGVQQLVGTVGGTGAPGDNVEFGQNLILTVTWGDEPATGQTVNAGEQVQLITDNSGTRTWTVTPGPGSGPADVSLALTFSPFYIFEQAIQECRRGRNDDHGDKRSQYPSFRQAVARRLTAGLGRDEHQPQHRDGNDRDASARQPGHVPRRSRRPLHLRANLCR